MFNDRYEIWGYGRCGYMVTGYNEKEGGLEVDWNKDDWHGFDDFCVIDTDGGVRKVIPTLPYAQ